MKILVVDDSRAIRILLRRILSAAGGIEVHEAASGEDALELCDAIRPDLVLTDWHLDGMTGLELLWRLEARGARIPVGLVTSSAGAQERRQAFEAGVSFVLNKPFDPAELLRAIENARRS